MTASTTLRRLTAALAAAALAVAAFAGCTGAPSSSEQSGGDAQTSQIERVSSHDPSIVKDGDTYYVFGSTAPGPRAPIWSTGRPSRTT